MQRTAISSVLLLFLVVLTVSLTATAQITTDPDISSLLNTIDSTRLNNTDLTLQNFFNRNACSDVIAPGQGVNPARDYIASRFLALPGVQVRLDPFVHPSCPSKPTFNVIAWI